MNKKVAALNTCIVFLNSLGYVPNIAFDKKIIDSFYNGNYQFLIHNKRGAIVGFIDYNIYGVSICLPLKMQESATQEISGIINIDDPQVVNFWNYKKSEDAQINGSFNVRYQELDNGEKNYYVTVGGTYKAREIEHQFSLAQQYSEITTTNRGNNDFDGFSSHLCLNPKGEVANEDYIKYKYSGSSIQPFEVEDFIKDSYTKGHIRGEKLIIDLHAQEIVKTGRVYTNSIYEEQDQEKSIGQIVRLMKTVNSQFSWQINSLRVVLGSWLDSLLDLCFPNYTDEEIRTLFGIERTKVIFQNGNETLTNINVLYQPNNQRIRTKNNN